ncbi:hypothetical protein AVEN_11368-1 [Araneus ventricosus]|uniref:Uncharacterized protein n=1 Tax=Araneus ventricosus TaxID=182803 RepID=A0A4Y2Q0E6_ARAVE|nr:hypothetical protein AVEN_11368-1 [Araneus ventricosus]
MKPYHSAGTLTQVVLHPRPGIPFSNKWGFRSRWVSGRQHSPVISIFYGNPSGVGDVCESLGEKRCAFLGGGVALAHLPVVGVSTPSKFRKAPESSGPLIPRTPWEGRKMRGFRGIERC